MHARGHNQLVLCFPPAFAAPTCTCADAQPGTRLVWNDTSYYYQPCKAYGTAAPLPKCEMFYFTGKRAATSSGCNEEPTCYIEVQRGASKVYVAERLCSAQGQSNIGRPSNANCPQPGEWVHFCMVGAMAEYD